MTPKAKTILQIKSRELLNKLLKETEMFKSEEYISTRVYHKRTTHVPLGLRHKANFGSAGIQIDDSTLDVRIWGMNMTLQLLLFMLIRDGYIHINEEVYKNEFE